MKKIYNLLTLVFTLACFAAAAQWTARAGMGTTNNRTFATSFSINGKIYVVGGNANFSGLSDVWEYNVTANTWAQKADFPGGIRGGGVAFAIGTNGYFISGANYVGQFFNDVWEYNSLNDTWTQKADAPFFGRHEGVGFAIGNLGYFGTGYTESVGPNSTSWNTFNDFWEYNPTTDTWVQKADVPGPTRGWAVGATANGSGYIGLGGNDDQNASFSDFYEYDPAQNVWTPKSSYPQMLADAGYFSVGGEVYVCGGIDFTSMTPTANFRKFIPSTNTWSAMPVFSGGFIMGSVGASTSNRMFLGTGYNGSLVERQDWWEFVVTSTTCPGPITFNTATVATNGSLTCTGKITLSSITNACSPYTLSILPANGTITAGANSATITGLCAGTYTVKVIDNNCCGSLQKVCVVPAALATGLTENDENASELNIAPNPNNGNFMLQLPGNVAVQKNNLRIVDLVGKQVEFHLDQHANGTEIKLGDVAKGIYFLNYSHPQGIITSKFVIE